MLKPVNSLIKPEKHTG